MTPLGELLAAEIQANGPISFHRFMETALYHPEHGYYRRERDPFGKGGDFYTAEQLQPVFGSLMAARIRQLYAAMGCPGEFTVVELGAGRREMAEAFAEWRYVPVDLDGGELPAGFTGVLFTNEFFDALPVHVARWQGGAYREQLVGMEGDAFRWEAGGPPPPECERFLRSYLPAPEEGRVYEACPDALRWLDRIGTSLRRGYALTIDYGYTRREAIRFPEGTLMSYRRHAAIDDVLAEPGARDITAHVNFTALQEYGASAGLATERLENLSQTLLAAGEADQFAGALEHADEREALRRRMQLKTLLFGMGETFRTLLQLRDA